MGVVWFGVVPAVSSVALCAGLLWCGWRGHVVVLRPVIALDIGGESGGLGVFIWEVLAEG